MSRGTEIGPLAASTDLRRNARPSRWWRPTAWWAASAVGLLHVLTAQPAAAQSQATNRVLAEGLFREGRELMDQDKISEACAKFAESYRLDHAMGTLLNLAVCHEKEGKTATAWSEFSDAAAEATTERDERVAFAQKRAAALAPELSRAQLSIAPAASSLASLDIQVDKTRLGRGAWTSAIPLDPGEHEVTASADGKKPYHATFIIPKGPTVTPVSVPALEDAPQEAPKPPTPSPETSSGGGGTQRGIGYVVGALGIVGIGVGTAFGLRAMSLKDDRDGQCDPSHVCSPTGVDSDKDARSAATLSTVGFIAGGALLAGGVVLVLTAPSSRTVKVGTSGRGVFIGGTF